VFHLAIWDAEATGINSTVRIYARIDAVNMQLLLRASSIVIGLICRGVPRHLSSLHRRDLYRQIRTRVHYRCAGIDTRCIDLSDVFTICETEWTLPGRDELHLITKEPRRFQLFYWCHMLTLPWLIILLVHGSYFWKWVLIPGILYAIEKILRYRKSRSNKHGETFVMEAILLPSQVRSVLDEREREGQNDVSSLGQVIHLVINKPRKFTYKPGDYIYINIPAVANFEWHPFSISSAPEHKGTDENVFFHFTHEETAFEGN
jgi:hypothetical protein